MKTLKQVTRVGSQSSEIGSDQGKWDDSAPGPWVGPGPALALRGVAWRGGGAGGGGGARNGGKGGG